MHVYKRSLVFGVIALFFAVGCAPLQSSVADESVGQTDAQTPANESKLAQLLEAADAAQGKRLYLQCRACHTLEAGGMNTVGPNLHGLFGKSAAQAEGFSYSDVLLESDIVWTADTLDQWLARPSDFLPGNRMIFAGVTDPADRADLILYLQQATSDAD